jgi:hypothetical protein
LRREAATVQPIISTIPTGFTILRWCKGIQIDNLAIPHRDDHFNLPRRCDCVRQTSHGLALSYSQTQPRGKVAASRAPRSIWVIFSAVRVHTDFLLLAISARALGLSLLDSERRIYCSYSSSRVKKHESWESCDAMAVDTVVARR